MPSISLKLPDIHAEYLDKASAALRELSDAQNPSMLLTILSLLCVRSCGADMEALEVKMQGAGGGAQNNTRSLNLAQLRAQSALSLPVQLGA